MIQAALVDMENMLDLLEIAPSVVDRPGYMELIHFTMISLLTSVLYSEIM